LKDKVVIVTGGAGGIGLATGYIVAGFTSVHQRLSVVDLLSRQFRLVPEFDAAVLRGVLRLPIHLANRRNSPSCCSDVFWINFFALAKDISRSRGACGRACSGALGSELLTSVMVLVFFSITPLFLS